MLTQGKRLGREMNLMKPPDRASLGDTHFKQSVSVGYNSPSINNFEFERLAKEWLKLHQTAFQFDPRRSGERSKEVIKRLAKVKKHTFLNI